MSHLPIVIFAYLLNSISILISKFLLIKKIPDPLVYIFYISLMSLLVLVLFPLTKTPSLDVFILASTSTLFWTTGAYFMFKALKIGQIQRVIPIIGTLIPLILLFFASKEASITSTQTQAVLVLVVGLIFITLPDWRGKLKKNELGYEILAALLFALSYILLREAYLKEGFLTVLVYSRIILLPLGAIILLNRKLRSKIIINKKPSIKFLSSLGIIFLLGQLAGGLAELLLLFSISLANPALVNSLQGTQYIFLLIFNLVLSKKYPEIFKVEKSVILKLLQLLGVVIIALGLYMLSSPPKNLPEVKFGVTFSPRYAYDLNLNPQTTYIKILDELGVKRVRIPIYWDEVEKFPRELNFSSIDYYLSEAQKRDVEVILVLGYKQPRWPECFAPEWVAKLMRKDREERILELVQKEVEYFKKYSNIILWQVENEPFLIYGICDPVNEKTAKLIKEEVSIIKSLDKRPVMITDSGELGFWTNAQKLSDTFGTTLYRQVWSPYFGVVEYPFPPFFYSSKNQIVKILTGNKGETIISELQAEPWLKGGERLASAAIDKQVKGLPVSKLKSYVEYASQTGFREIYLWGVEWWYFMDKNGHPEYLEYTKSLFIN